MEEGKPVLDPMSEQDDSVADTASVADPLAQLEVVAAERDRLAAEKDDLRDRLLRRQADFENYRKRSERERAELLEFAGMESVRVLLPVLDDFERALKAESRDPDYASGVEIIYRRLYETLKKLGLEPIEAVGRAFDPHVHHAVEMVQSEDAEDQSVLEELQRGYNFKGRLLRPAMVRVAVKP